MKTHLIAILSCICIVVNAQIPSKFVGNWINETTNDWEYGFFEKFAIYDCDYWDYESIKENDQKTFINLKNGNRLLSLEIIGKNDSAIVIKEKKGKKQSYSLMGKRYPAYKTKDNSEFPAPTFKQDSAVILGYYRNFDKIPEQFRQQFGKNYFSVEVPSFINGEAEDHVTDIDSLGRFIIKFPIVNTQMVFTDWGRLSQNSILEPGDTLFLFMDMEDILPRESDGSWDGYRNRPKQILHMGKNARVNNEWLQYQSPEMYIDFYEEKKKGTSDMDYLKLCEDAYNKKANHLDSYIDQNPNVSGKFIFSKYIDNKYSSASKLMQYRFSLDENKGGRFSPGFMEYVNQKFPLTDERYYTFTRDFKWFLTDYIGYYSDIKPMTVSIFPDMIGEQLEKEDKMTDEIKEYVEAYKKYSDKLGRLEDSLQKVKLFEDHKELFERINSNKLIATTREQMFRSAFFEMEVPLIDSLIDNSILKELWFASSYYKMFDHYRSSMSKTEMDKFNDRINNPFLRNTLLTINKHYENIDKMGLAEIESIKDTRHLENVLDFKELFNQLVEPYKGKVIYIDFWGTWCGPCRRNMKLMGGVEDALKDKDVIFMYFANNSPETTWQNVIKEMELTGDDIVHYRLPGRQQNILETNLSISSWPTYMLVDKEGNIVNKNAPSPQASEELIIEIEKLLNE